MRGAKIAATALRTLTAPALDVHNLFEQPNAVTAPADMTPDWKGEPLVLTLPKASASSSATELAERRGAHGDCFAAEPRRARRISGVWHVSHRACGKCLREQRGQRIF